MDTFRRNWWIGIAVAMAAMQTAFGVVNLVEDDGGPVFGNWIVFTLLVTGSVLIVVGIATRSRNRAFGSTLVGVGVLPSAMAISILWFPPAALYGILAIFTAGYAFRDASSNREPTPA